MIRTTIDDAQVRLRELIDAALQGEEVVITAADEHGEKTIHLIVGQRDETAPKRRQFGSARGLIWMSDDFDEPLEEFEEYMR